VSANNKNTYLLLNFDELNEKGLNKLKQAITKAGYEVVKVTPAGTARKKDGIPTKTFELKGMDEQVMSVQVNNTGDISGIKLNGKNAPFTHVKTMAELGKSLADLFNKGSTAFQKALARKLARAAKMDLEKDKPASSRGVKSGVQMLSDARARRDVLKEGIKTVSEKLVALQSEQDLTQKEHGTLQSDLNLEVAKTEQLQQQISKMKGGQQ